MVVCAKKNNKMKAYCFKCERETAMIVEQAILIEEEEEIKHYGHCNVCLTRVCKVIATE